MDTGYTTTPLMRHAAPLPDGMSVGAGLFVSPDAEQFCEKLEGILPGVNLTYATSVMAARAHMAGTPFDVVVVDSAVAEDAAAWIALVETASDLKSSRHVLAIAPGDVAAEQARAAGANEAFVHPVPADVIADHVVHALGLSLFDGISGDGALAETVEAANDDLEAIREELGRMAHALNNPLAVIHGNAQYVLELAQALELDDCVVAPLRDIEEAGSQLATLFRAIGDLRHRIGSASGARDTIPMPARTV